MKKSVAIAITILLLVISIPGFDVMAFEGTDICIRTVETIDVDTSTDLGNALHSLVLLEDEDYSNSVIDALNNFDFSLLDDYSYYTISATWTSTSGGHENYSLYVNGFNSNVEPYILSQNYNDSHYPIQIWVSTGSPFVRECCSFSYNSWTGSWADDGEGNVRDYDYNGYASLNLGRYLLDCNMPVYSYHEANIIKPESVVNVNEWVTLNHSSLTELFGNQQGYNLDGDIVSPGAGGVEIESNENHMYFKSCELGFCVPQGTVNSSNYGGAYAYIKYTVDDWVVNHISDYEIVLNASTVVGSGNTLEGSYYLPLDRDGCVEIPFSDLGQLRSLTSYGFISSTTNNVVEQNYYKTYLYTVPYNSLSNFIAKNNAAANTDNISTLWSMLRSGSIYTLLLYNGETTQGLNYLSAVSQSLIQSYSPYSITLRAVLRTTDGELNSGLVETTFNLVTGNQNNTNTSGLVNDDPFDPQPDPENPDVPTIPQGNSTDPTVVINTGGTFTGQITAGFDPGYTELKQDINLDPQGNFSQYLDPMHNTEVGSWFMSFVNEMPTQMKLILISGCGAGVLFGLYRFIRRG